MTLQVNNKIPEDLCWLFHQRERVSSSLQWWASFLDSQLWGAEKSAERKKDGEPVIIQGWGTVICVPFFHKNESDRVLVGAHSQRVYKCNVYYIQRVEWGVSGAINIVMVCYSFLHEFPLTWWVVLLCDVDRRPTKHTTNQRMIDPWQ